MDAVWACWKFARSVPVIAILALFASGMAPAKANDAETFIQDYVQHGLTILNDKSFSHAEKHKQFQALLEPMTDMRRVALYALGPAAQNAPTEQLEAFVKAFHDLELSLYERELWRVQQLKVETSIERAKGDTIVRAFQLDSTGYRSVNADEIDFRVLSTAGKPILADLCVRGAWIAVNQRVQYKEFLARRGNTLPKLIAKLHNRTSKMNRYFAAGEVPIRPVRTRSLAP